MFSAPRLVGRRVLLAAICTAVVTTAAGQEHPLAGPALNEEAVRTRTREGADDRPNYVIILADDLGYADVGFNGRKEYNTPNLDRFARQGTIFRRFYSGGVICGPSRACLLTGKYTIHNGVSGNNADLPRDQTTIAAALKPLGYHSGVFGKWHGGTPRAGETGAISPLERGFDEFIGYMSATEAWEHFPKYFWFGREKRPVSGYSADLVSQYGIDFVKRNRDQPFFLYLAFVEPHLKLQAPAENIARLRGKIQEYDPARPENATYGAMIERFDAAVGRFLDALDAAGLTRNTVVVLSSDHGATFEGGNVGASADLDSNHPFRGGKRSVYEGGTRVPTVIRWPGHVPPGRTSNEILSQIDILPTFMAMAGAKPDPAWSVDGQDELAVWEGKVKAADRTLFWEFRDEGWYNMAALRGDWKLVVQDRQELEFLQRIHYPDQASIPAVADEILSSFQPPNVGTLSPEARRSLLAIMGSYGPQLYNIAKDPDERRNYFFARPTVSVELRRSLLDWLSTESDESKQSGSAAPMTPARADGPD
jgi:arylsulfatase A